MKKIIWAAGSLILATVVLFAVSSRNLGELVGFVRATADQTVEQLEHNVPNAVRDQKLRNDIEQARGDIIDRRVKLNLTASQIRQMQEEIDQLAGATKRRDTILAEAYPALEAAAADRVTEVSFAGTQWLPSELGSEIDRLLMEQDRDERQLEIRREALERLVKSVEDGSAAIAQMEAKLLEAESEFQALVVRREQAENENELLDLVAVAGRSGKTAAAQIGSNLATLRGDVAKLEARNEARRDSVPLADREKSRLTRAWDRLERLKTLHEKREAERGEAKAVIAGDDADAAAPAAADAAEEANPANKDVIIVIKDAKLEPAAKDQQ